MIPLSGALRYNQGMTHGTKPEMNSRDDLVMFIYTLQDELDEHPESWGNKDLVTYLGALARFLNDADGYYHNMKLEIDADVPSWRLMADSLRAASEYD